MQLLQTLNLTEEEPPQLNQEDDRTSADESNPESSLQESDTDTSHVDFADFVDQHAEEL